MLVDQLPGERRKTVQSQTEDKFDRKFYVVPTDIKKILRFLLV